MTLSPVIGSIVAITQQDDQGGLVRDLVRMKGRMENDLFVGVVIFSFEGCCAEGENTRFNHREWRDATKEEIAMAVIRKVLSI